MVILGPYSVRFNNYNKKRSHVKKIWCALCCRDEEEGYGEGDDDDPLSRRRKKKKYVNMS